jgi:hypothetical protein
LRFAALLPQFTVGGLEVGAPYLVRVWALDQAGYSSTVAATFSGQVVAAAPVVVVQQQPGRDSPSNLPLLLFAAVWPNGTQLGDSSGVPSSLSGGNTSSASNGTSAAVVAGATFEVLMVNDAERGSWHDPCTERRANCSVYPCGNGTCAYRPYLEAPQGYTVLVCGAAARCGSLLPPPHPLYHQPPPPR